MRFSEDAVTYRPITVRPHEAVRLPWIVWSALALIALTIVGAIVVAPIAQAAGYSSFALTIYKIFSFVCHQIPERSLHIAGHEFAVCSRCTGLYSGLAFATLAYPLARPLKRADTPRIIWLILSALPLTIDFSLGYFSIWHNNNFTRFTTGALLGAVAVFYIVPGLVELTSNLSQRWYRRT